MLKRSKHKNRMGKRSENCMGFTEELLFNLQQSGCHEMTTDHAGCLSWLEDLDMSNKDQKELATKIHMDWDVATK